MSEPADKIASILVRIYAEESFSPKVDKPSFAQFIKSLINGDDVKNYIVFSASIPQEQTGVIAYILTNAKLIKVTITESGFDSESAYLNKIISVDKSVTDEKGEKRTRISVEFQQGSFGLRYPAGNEEVDLFFQAVDQAVKDFKVANAQKI